METLRSSWRSGLSDTTRTFLLTEISCQYVLIIHEVANYPAWKQVFDNAAGIRKEAGERSFQVLNYQDDPNKIAHFSAWTSIADARRFFESPRLVKIREEAGVKSPDFTYFGAARSGHSVTVGAVGRRNTGRGEHRSC